MAQPRNRTLPLIAAGAAVLALSVVVGTADRASGAASFSVAVTPSKTWLGGFQEQVTVTNNTGAAVNGWVVQFDLDPSEAITSSWSSVQTTTGHHESFVNASFNGKVANGASVSFGFNGSDTIGFIAPKNVVVGPPGIPLPPTTTATTPPPPTTTTPTTTTPTTTTAPPATTTPPPPPPQFTQADIDAAVATPLVAFAAPNSGTPRPGTNPKQMLESMALYYLALVDKTDPGAAATNGTTVDETLLAQVRHLIAGGNEPDADGGLEGWSHAPVAVGLLLLRNGSAWSELTAAEQSKVSLLEAAMGYAGNYAYNDANDFASGICGFGNFAKTNNPNYRDGYVDVEAAAIEYFGASNWDSMLTGFSAATEVSQLTAAGLTNAAGCYQTVGTAADAAIDRPFRWEGHGSADVMGIWNQLAADTFDQTVTSVNGPAHIADDTTSPEQGLLGMGHEFASTDSGGLRSSALYVFEGWMNVTGTRAAMTALGTFDCAAAGSAARYQVGTLDLIYKLHHGYVSFAASQSGVLVDDHGDPSSDGPNAKGYQLDLDAYDALIANQGC
ncbi:MAG TPA: cellulose binding domain-containing protein [Pseudonocardiaceae bacterium]|jgi:hypothetical protein|nr:cellulose binding domain-containing protein [Pseudonocardiaceae bacterium]